METARSLSCACGVKDILVHTKVGYRSFVLATYYHGGVNHRTSRYLPRASHTRAGTKYKFCIIVKRTVVFILPSHTQNSTMNKMCCVLQYTNSQQLGSQTPCQRQPQSQPQPQPRPPYIDKSLLTCTRSSLASMAPTQLFESPQMMNPRIKLAASTTYRPSSHR